jgi:predicted alpha/beta superfamily hydrolase
MSESHEQVTIPDTELRILSSTNVNQEFSIFIALPHSYTKSEQSYPVVYVLDANFLFGMMTETTRLLYFPKELQELIIVGVGYPDIVSFGSSMGLRTRDYTPTNHDWYETKYAVPGSSAPKFVGEGEAANFLQFLSEELVPFINKNYRTLPDENALLGRSFGGLFVLYALFRQPGNFKRYFAGSPSLWWKTIFDLEKEFASNNDDLKAGLFMSVGGDEPDFMISDMYKMAYT